MPTFDSPEAQSSIKMLFLGDSGAGKTGATASLASAGYKVRILDLDRGVEVLRDFFTNPKSMYVSASPGHWPKPIDLLKRVSFVTITEEYNVKGGQPIPKGAAWQRIGNQLNEWVDGKENLGNIGTWGPDTVLVIDGLSRASDAAFNHQLVLNGRALSGPQQADYGVAQRYVERLLTMLYQQDVKCHVIVIAHIAFIETDAGPTKGFAQTIGKAISPKVGQWFNHAILAKTSGQGEAVKRVILTNTSGMVELKNPAPLRVAKEYPLATGLSDYFADVQGGKLPGGLLRSDAK